ncbi:MAG: orotidine 5'-phosphate decarboxylase [Anaerolineaceae bacterium]|nr:orotidine 5'-phosphate decarboxylase [Anaerolineaceae bacterium]
MIQLDNKHRYLQIAFNDNARMVSRILPTIPNHPRIFIEAGTPYIKQEGMDGIRHIRRMWRGIIVADLKIADGAVYETQMAYYAGANAATCLGSAPTPTLDLFIKTCRSLGMYSMLDMIGVSDPLKVMRPLKAPPDVVILHRGRDEETARSKMIEYRHVNRIHSKFDTLISVAGGVNEKEARSAIFNGANIVVANIVNPEDGWTGISTDGSVGEAAAQFLNTIA